MGEEVVCHRQDVAVVLMLNVTNVITLLWDGLTPWTQVLQMLLICLS